MFIIPCNIIGATQTWGSALALTVTLWSRLWSRWPRTACAPPVKPGSASNVETVTTHPQVLRLFNNIWFIRLIILDCETIRRWLTKCADDSETANYISAHTKDCPKCNICIEKNGGCNHMQCYNCKHDFCWMCLGDWRTHGSEYYECSRYISFLTAKFIIISSLKIQGESKYCKWVGPCSGQRSS